LLSATDVTVVVPIVVLMVGAITAVLAILASKTQHDYYKNIRDLKEDLEQRLQLGSLGFRTTRGMGGARWRIARITTFQQFILALLLIADLTVLGAAIAHAAPSDPVAKVMVVLQVSADVRPPSRAVPVVLSQAGKIVASASALPEGIVTLRVAPGQYLVSAFAQGVCRRNATVSPAPLQRLRVRCP
jgi:hypothetical protein